VLHRSSARCALAGAARGLAAVALLAATPLLPVRAATLAAQQVERPVPFDPAGRIVLLTPSLAERLQLGAPLFPVTGEWREARLFDRGDAYVLVVVRPDAAVARWTLARPEGDALRALVAARVQASGVPVQQDVASEVAETDGSARLVRGQTINGLTVYGGGLAAWSARPEPYFLGAAAAFFGASAVSRRVEVTRSMALLANDFGVRGGVLGLLGAVATDASPRTAGALAVTGGLLAAGIGLQQAKGYTLSEAEAAGWGSTTTALTLLGAAGIVIGGDTTSTAGRTAAVAAATGLVLGVPAGVLYARRAGHVLTSGDLYAARVPQAVGALIGGTFASAIDANTSAGFALTTAGYLGGVLAGDRWLARPFDHSMSEGALLGLGATVGGFAAATPFLARTDTPDATATLAAVTAGTVLGAWGAHALFTPRLAREWRDAGDDDEPAAYARHDGSRASHHDATRGGVRWRLDPFAAFAAWRRQRGTHAILTVSF
jgi:hypothetical protein